MRRLYIVLCAAMLASTAAFTEEHVPIAVVVHPARADRLGTEELAEIYLKKRRFWDDGAPILPLNQPPGTTARESFSRRVLGGTSQSFAEYWNEQYFHGIFPPATLSSDEAVKRYVAAERNAIGYIEATDVDDTVRVVLHLR